MKAKVIQTTDRKFLWNVYEVDALEVEKIKDATGWKFVFDTIEVTPPLIKLQNSNYTAILKFIS